MSWMDERVTDEGCALCGAPVVNVYTTDVFTVGTCTAHARDLTVWMAELLALWTAWRQRRLVRAWRRTSRPEGDTMEVFPRVREFVGMPPRRPYPRSQDSMDFLMTYGTLRMEKGYPAVLRCSKGRPAAEDGDRMRVSFDALELRLYAARAEEAPPTVVTDEVHRLKPRDP